MSLVASKIHGYAYGSPEIAPSPVTLAELASLRATVGFGTGDEGWLRRAGDVLADQTAAIVAHWRSNIIAGIPHLARHSRGIDGQPLPDYLAASNLRFGQWILDTCRRPYDQDWLNYQHEIARRHTSSLKNLTDGVASTPFVPLRDVLGFVATMEPDDRAVPESRWPVRRRRGGDARGMVQVSPTASGALGEGVLRPVAARRPMVNNRG